jgi:signal peptidase II
MGYLIIIISIIIFDQWTKHLANIHLKSIETYPLIQDVFHFTFRKNRGAAFSMLRDKQTFLIIITSIVVAILIVYLMKIMKKQNLLLIKLPMAFIIGGAIGNLIDRIRLKYVIDFFDFTLINFAVFNVADVFIVIGSIVFAYAVIFKNVKI